MIRKSVTTVSSAASYICMLQNTWYREEQGLQLDERTCPKSHISDVETCKFNGLENIRTGVAPLLDVVS